MYSSKNSHDDFIKIFLDQIEEIQDDNILLPHTHKSAWSPKLIIQLLNELKFRSVRTAVPKDSIETVFKGKIFDETRPHMSFIVEARK